jgi:hypothetical protein
MHAEDAAAAGFSAEEDTEPCASSSYRANVAFP